MTPLHVAAWEGNIEVVRLLLENKANINVQSEVSRIDMIWLLCRLIIDFLFYCLFYFSFSLRDRLPSFALLGKAMLNL